MRPFLCAFLLGLGLLALHAPRAEAHGPGYVVLVHEGKAVRRFRPDLPRWLSHDYAFHSWLVHSPHYHLRHPDWQRLYRLYRKDAAWHRRGQRHHRRGYGHRR